MKQKHKKIIVFTLIFSFLLLGTGVFINKNSEAQASDGEMLTMLRGMNQVLGLIAERLTVFNVKDGSVGIGTTSPLATLEIRSEEDTNRLLRLTAPNRQYINFTDDEGRSIHFVGLIDDDKSMVGNRAFGVVTSLDREENIRTQFSASGNAYFDGNVTVGGHFLHDEPRSAQWLSKESQGVDDFSLATGLYAFNNHEHAYETHSIPFNAGLLEVKWRVGRNSVFQKVYEYGSGECFYTRYGNPEDGGSWGDWYKHCGEKI